MSPFVDGEPVFEVLKAAGKALDDFPARQGRPDLKRPPREKALWARPHEGISRKGSSADSGKEAAGLRHAGF